MNRPDKAGEPSMEEILASIRQIIADEPSSDRPDPAIEANPLVPQSAAPKSTADTRVPLADRLSGVLKGGSLPPTSPLGSKRPLSFDQDLADMFDEEEPVNGTGVVAPKPDTRVPAGLSHPMGTKPFVARGDEAKPAVVDRVVVNAPTTQRPASEALVPPPPFGGAETPAVEPPPPTTFGFPPLRKASFYPPSSNAPSAPMASPANPFSTGSPAEPSSGADGIALNEPARFDETLSDGDLGSVVSGQSGGASAPPTSADPFEAQPAASQSDSAPTYVEARADDFGSKPAAETPREAPAVSPSASPFPSFPSSSSPSSPSFAASPAPSARPEFGASTSTQPFTAPPPSHDAAGQRSYDARPTGSHSYPDPFAQSVYSAHGEDMRSAHSQDTRSAHGQSAHSAYGQDTRSAHTQDARSAHGPAYTGQTRFSPAPGMSADAAHLALDALAQGLAASVAGSSPAADAASHAIPLTPVFEPEPAARPGSPYSPSTLPAPIPSGGSMPVTRTLEDAVADMLRPMLQQWVADNMPRIIERALRTEVANSVKPGNKPPGT